LGLADALADLTGSPLAPTAIAEASEQVQRARDLLARLTVARLARPARLTGTVALHAYAAFTVLPPDEFAELAAELLAQVEQMPERTGPRLFVGGSPFDHDRFYRLVERSGATIVAEDHCWGARTCDRVALAHGADPLERIAERYHLMPACSIRFPLASSRAATVTRALAADADGAIFVTFERDAVQAWETPGEVEQLRASGMKVLQLSDQAYACDGDGLAEEVDAFLASLNRVPAS
jgi:benzoyl-CoA reductase/2-hydroxyglutaryl-CoA dehydratase subunit BcrC/BadD/HgdB